MVGLGAQDSLEEAEEFVSTFETTFTMLWDPTFESWANLGVSLQPSAILLDGDGTLLGRWLGAFPEEEVLDLVRGADPVGQVVADSPRFCRYAARYVEAARVLDDVEERAIADRPIVFDDIRFGANAMAQTAPESIATAVRQFADAVQDLATAAIDSGYDLDEARAVGGYDRLDAARRAAAEPIADQVNDACGVGFTG